MCVFFYARSTQWYYFGIVIELFKRVEGMFNPDIYVRTSWYSTSIFTQARFQQSYTYMLIRNFRDDFGGILQHEKRYQSSKVGTRLDNSIIILVSLLTLHPLKISPLRNTPDDVTLMVDASFLSLCTKFLVSTPVGRTRRKIYIYIYFSLRFEINSLFN